MSIKFYKYRFYPTPEQEVILAKTFGCVRYVYNRALRHKSDTYKETGMGVSFTATSKKLTGWKKDEETVWLKEVSCIPLQQTLRHLDVAFGNFFKKRSKYPSFKRRSHRNSAEFTRNGFKWQNGVLTIAKLGKMNICWSRRFKAEPSTVTLSRTPAGKYYVAIRIDEENRVEPNIDAEIGIDIGIANLATDSEGQTIANQRNTKLHAKRLASAQRIMSRRVKGSNRWNRARIKVARIQESITNKRRDWTHKATTAIVRTKQFIVIEDLKVSNMLKNRKLAKAIADASWFEFRRQLVYKCEWYGRELVVVPSVYTSQTCSVCGHCEKDNRQSQTTFECLKCSHVENADVNAAKNILAVGRTVSGRGGDVSRPQASSVGCKLRRSVKQLKLVSV